VAQIRAVIAELPTYGYRRVHAILKRHALAAGLKPPNHKRVYRVMKVHDLLLDRHAGATVTARSTPTIDRGVAFSAFVSVARHGIARTARASRSQALRSHPT
jgi:hypothetical protein